MLIRLLEAYLVGGPIAGALVLSLVAWRLLASRARLALEAQR